MIMWPGIPMADYNVLDIIRKTWLKKKKLSGFSEQWLSGQLICAVEDLGGKIGAGLS